MNDQEIHHISPQRKFSAWMIHLFTASAAILGLFTLHAIYQGHYIFAFWLMGVTIAIDSVDGSLARFVRVKIAAPKIDGMLLDNIVDYLNYVITPAFFLLVSNLLPVHLATVGASLVVLCSAYQFTQAEAKTEDHFFKGFPSYWNLVVFYLFLGGLSAWTNFTIIVTLSILIFVPIKYLYLSRLDNVTKNKTLKLSLILFSIIYGVSSVMLLIEYPKNPLIFVVISWAFILLYLGLSLYRTFVPIESQSSSSHSKG